ncbi:sulfite exporter TauE/SafE family protein [Alkaliphilus transvaalensis]|uniref:sulfite exporter TauE/SafE family protein n=1 Tax=Alkaliphilus transvaalensis TaxID=114628 RepID=UPI00047D0602|nr:sulfite exporter TauE/SafE family protein [Alkaliphilus transvaalensis]
MEESIKLILGFIIIFLSSMTQGMISFGFSLVALPLLGMFLPLQIVVPILVIYSLILNSMILHHIKEYINIKRIIILVVAGMVGTPFGAYLLKVTDEGVLKLVVGVIIIISTVINYYGYKIKVKKEKLSYLPVGLVSGILNGSVSLGGPPLVLFLTNQGVEKQTFRANLTTYFWLLNLFTIPTYLLGGLISQEVLRYGGLLVPALIMGTFLGIKLGDKVDEDVFKRLTLILIFVMGLLSIVSVVL